jgi:hypothetical protein
MVDPLRSGERPMTAICSWCSAEVSEGATECRSCGANLVPDGDPNVPGVTAVDAASIIRSKSTSQPRSRLLSWISGEYQTDVPSKAEQQAIAPPDLEVRREILRLELEAEVANLQAEADALRAEAAAEGRVVDFPEAAETGAAEEPEGAEAPEEAETAATDASASTEAAADDGNETVVAEGAEAASPSEDESEDKATA